MAEANKNTERSSVSSYLKGSGNFILSPTLVDVGDQFQVEEPISASKFTQTILGNYDHLKNYANGLFNSLTLQNTPIEKPVQQWIDEIQGLLDLNRIDEFIDPNEPHLHGRLAIICLCLLDLQLYQQCKSVGAFAALVSELRQPILDILNNRGRELFGRLQSAESVPTLTDDPLRDPRQDLLGRGAFARFLARRFISVPLDNVGAYNIHLYGPWGAGKSTLMNFISYELVKSGDWLVVEFNAWSNQHIQPPWWSLMDQIFQRTKKKLGFCGLIQEYWWRFNTGRLHIWVSIIVLAWILALIIFPLLGTQSEDAVLGLSATVAEYISKILALIATIWGGILAISRSLLLGSAKAAQGYSELTRDPTGEIKKRFKKLVKQLKPYKVAIFIDDLDRCQSKYVVDLLEGIQTLFREAPVFFVVAADRKWLNACYEQIYEKLEPRVKELGKPLGVLFLEKAFRFSTPMPSIPQKLKEEYWHHLLQISSGKQDVDLDEERAQAKTLVDNALNETEVRKLTMNDFGGSFVAQRAVLEEAVVRLAAPDIQERLEHTLEPYSEFLTPNPRAMKRLVNTYSSYRALALLSQIDIDQHQLVLWTVLSMRWPQLADRLSRNPELKDKIGQPDISTMPSELKDLLTEDEIVTVIQGGSMKIGLDTKTLRQCARIRA